MTVEARGLAAIAANAGTIHAIGGPPDRIDYRDREDYATALAAWGNRQAYWLVHLRESPPRPFWHDDCLPEEGT